MNHNNIIEEDYIQHSPAGIKAVAWALIIFWVGMGVMAFITYLT